MCKWCEVVTTVLCVLAMIVLTAGMTFTGIGWSCNKNGHFDAGPVRYECRPIYVEAGK